MLCRRVFVSFAGFPTNLKAEDFYVEFALLGFLLFYFVNYFYGGSVNQGIVKAWHVPPFTLSDG